MFGKGPVGAKKKGKKKKKETEPEAVPHHNVAPVPFAKGEKKKWPLTVAEGKKKIIGEFDKTTRELVYKDEKGKQASIFVDIPALPKLGKVRDVVPGKEHTLIVTDNFVIITLGWKRVLKGETTIAELDLWGIPLTTNAASIELSDESRGEKLVSWVMGKGRAYLLTKDGKLKYRVMGDIFADVYEIELDDKPSPLAKLYYKDGVLFFLQPGDTILAMKREEGGSWVDAELMLDFLAEGEPEIKEGKEGFIVKFGEHAVEVKVGKRGDPKSVKIIPKQKGAVKGKK